MLMKNMRVNQDKWVLVPRSIISADFWVLTLFPGSSGFVSSHLCGPSTLHHCRLLIPHLRAAHALFTSHSSPSSLMLLFVELNIEFFLPCLSTASIFHAVAWLAASQWNCADFRCIHCVNNNWDALRCGSTCVWVNTDGSTQSVFLHR